MQFVFPPKILFKFCFQFLERQVLVPREIEYNTCAKLCGENKLHHGQRETRQFQLFLRNLFTIEISELKYKSMNLYYVFPIQQGRKFVNPI